MEIIEWIGMIVVCYFGYLFIKEFKVMLFGNQNIQSKYGNGCWALVTGATDGIGKGFCQQLAQQGVNICIVARNKSKAENLIEELKKVNDKPQYKIVIADFQNCLQESFFQKIYQEVKDLDIGLLINNVGVLTVGEFHKTSDIDQQNQIIINCIPVVFMTKYLLPILKKRQRSGVICLSSLTGRFAYPYYQVYCATKAFNDYFTRSLEIEVDNVDFLSLRPGYVQTAMVKNQSDLLTVSTKQCVTSALSQLGYKEATAGHLIHRIQTFIFSLAEGKLMDIISPIVAKQLYKQKH
ncbi:unnamed protein product [Paramecium pentaurelia]|uniref:Uncharacterized protein n=1 Tax=Paramecium pentaurelia TaxID=43138 RepID=A0A8S1UC42_9CILI|nr:unnamed protein product [Paramecium pentaurelia]